MGGWGRDCALHHCGFISGTHDGLCNPPTPHTHPATHAPHTHPATHPPTHARTHAPTPPPPPPAPPPPPRNWRELDKELFLKQFSELKIIAYYKDVRRQLSALRAQGVVALARVEREMLLKVGAPAPGSRGWGWGCGCRGGGFRGWG